MGNINVDRAYDMLKASDRFTVTEGPNLQASPNAARSWKGCSVTAVQQDGGRKEHMALVSGEGETVIDVAAGAGTAWAAMSKYVGKVVDADLEWKRSLSGDGSYIQVKMGEQIERGGGAGLVVIDTETTGLNPFEDEILQLAIIDGDGNVILNERYGTDRVKEWPEAQAINGISPASVAGLPSFATSKKGLEFVKNILKGADEVVVYNAPFDLGFFGALGARMDTDKVVDAMLEYADFKAVPDGRHGGNKWYKLTDAAAEIGYSYKAHDALGDCMATLAVLKATKGERPAPAAAAATAKAAAKPGGLKPLHIVGFVFAVLFVLGGFSLAADGDIGSFVVAIVLAAACAAPGALKLKGGGK